MYFLYLIITLIIILRNPFSGKKYKTRLINKVILIYRSNPEIVIHDYYYYILNILDKNLANLKVSRVVFFECPGLSALKIFGKSIKIFLQIEHTLFRPESTASSSWLQSGLPILGAKEKYLIRIAGFDKLRFADVIFDYSRINLLNIQSSIAFRDYFKKTVCISPTLYPICTNGKDRNGIITLFGDPNLPRRKLFLENLQSNAVSIKNIQGVYLGVDQIYQSAKIVINIRQSDAFDTLEELRVLPALRSGAIVVCETAPYIEKTAYSKYIIWGSLSELPRLIMEVENNYDEIRQSIFGDGSENSSFVKRMKRIELCNELAMKRMVNRIIDTR